ncbi:NAD-dependent protein deacylase [[Clostridium] polysaccharolyticum]|uniref:NAD-dependent protein deacetylase n=1 Tax=[Clostridium] polysaccharolyticum TaxID=29364 RepID=A0A1I0D5Q4_9FIRM|nr:NAD-dependent protein deacylase [[Clostridium] polysaccharolyticum]SET27246.1 NAD-dependent deacetylase [[Clostridium] polysaccharolyticum]
MNDKIQILSEIIEQSNSIVFFGGAGISTASGIPDFRSSTGLYSKSLNRNFTPEQAVSHSFFRQHPEEFYEFYKKNLVYPDAKPNDCHFALAQLESMGKLKAVVTQNIDGLHQAAGSKIVYELHGSVLRNYCMSCHSFFNAEYVLNSVGIPRCDNCGGVIKPDVVLYEEGLDDKVITNSINAIRAADTLIIGGTSLIVYPAAGLINYFKGRKLVLINKTTTPADKKADLVINEDIAMVMKKVIEKMK